MASARGDALDWALALARVPGERFALRQQALPEGVDSLLQIAGGTNTVAIEEAAARVGMAPTDVVEAARFYMREVLFFPDADAYRVLGLASDATDGQIKHHHRLLQQWLHPDRPASDWDAAFAARVNASWSQVRSRARREAYDARVAQIVPDTVGEPAWAQQDRIHVPVIATEDVDAGIDHDRWRRRAPVLALFGVCAVLGVLAVRDMQREPEGRVASMEVAATAEVEAPPVVALKVPVPAAPEPQPARSPTKRVSTATATRAPIPTPAKPRASSAETAVSKPVVRPAPVLIASQPRPEPVRKAPPKPLVKPIALPAARHASSTAVAVVPPASRQANVSRVAVAPKPGSVPPAKPGAALIAAKAPGHRAQADAVALKTPAPLKPAAKALIPLPTRQPVASASKPVSKPPAKPVAVAVQRPPAKPTTLPLASASKPVPRPPAKPGAVAVQPPPAKPTTLPLASASKPLSKPAAKPEAVAVQRPPAKPTTLSGSTVVASTSGKPAMKAAIVPGKQKSPAPLADASKPAPTPVSKPPVAVAPRLDPKPPAVVAPAAVAVAAPAPVPATTPAAGSPEQVAEAQRIGQRLLAFVAGRGNGAPPIWANLAAQNQASQAREALQGAGRVAVGAPDWRVGGGSAAMQASLTPRDGGARRLRVDLVWRERQWLVSGLVLEQAR